MSKSAACLLFAAAVLVPGCATPVSRIRRNPETFAAFAPEVQENVRQGRIRVGYTVDMVFIALGAPDRKYERLTEGGSTEIWTYTGAYYTTDSTPVEARCWVRGAHGGLHLFRDRVWADISVRHEYATLRVEFRDEKVTAIETLRP
jgi:hypothetical protein